jgi:hypothetical protein
MAKRNLILKLVIGGVALILMVAIFTIVLLNISYTGSGILALVIIGMYMVNHPFAKIYRRPGLLVFSIIICLLMGLVFLGMLFSISWIYISTGQSFDLTALLVAVLFTAFVLVIQDDIKNHVSRYQWLRHQAFPLR